MKRTAPNPVQGGDELDALLGAFFRSELPDPWPAFAPPPAKRVTPGASSPAPNATPRPVWAGYLALALTLALLCFGAWATPSVPRSTDSSGIRSITDPSAGMGLPPLKAPSTKPDKKQGPDNEGMIPFPIDQLPFGDR